MSYDQYLFLMETNEPVRRISDGGILEIAKERYDRYMKEYYPEGHGYPGTVSTEDGRQIDFPMLKEKYQWKLENPYTAAIAFAVRRVAWEAFAFNVRSGSKANPNAGKKGEKLIESLPYLDLLGAMQEWLAKQIVKDYRQMQVLLSQVTNTGDYHLHLRTEILYRLRRSFMGSNPLPPFSDPCKPWMYPAQRLNVSSAGGSARRIILCASLHR